MQVDHLSTVGGDPASSSRHPRDVIDRRRAVLRTRIHGRTYTTAGRSGVRLRVEEHRATEHYVRIVGVGRDPGLLLPSF